MSGLRAVYKAYEDLVVMEGLDLDLPNHKIVCIVGPSGCGKTTLLNLIGGLTMADDGHIDTQGERIGYIFQEDRLLPWENVYQNIAFVKPEVNHQKIMDIIDQVGLTGFEHSYPEALSGGMRQRCSIARAFYYEASLLLMDEPFKSLDYDLKRHMIQYLILLWEASRSTVVYVTHDIDEALLLGHQVLVLSKRPARVVKSYKLETSHQERHLSDEDLLVIRLDIIKQMTVEEME